MGGNLLKSVGILSMTAHDITTDADPNSYQDHFSNKNMQVFSWALEAPIISLNNALFLVWLPDYKVIQWLFRCETYKLPFWALSFAIEAPYLDI